MIHGMTVRLWVKTLTSTDGFGEPLYSWSYEDVEDVLVSPDGSEEHRTDLDLKGKSIAYVLGIPKGDSHDWQDTIVEFFGEKFQTVGIPEMGIEENVPLRWHKKVKCVRYE